MRSLINICLLVLALLIFLPGCRQSAPPPQQAKKKNYEKPLIEANKHVVKTERQHIDDFLRRYKWDMNETGSGLLYMIYQDGDGDAAIKGKTAVLNYSVKLITGDVVYSSEQSGPMQFIIGKANVISGLEEGILLLNVGDKAKFIIPSHLAYGLLGDDNKIPGKATLIYDIEFIEIK